MACLLLVSCGGGGSGGLVLLPEEAPEVSAAGLLIAVETGEELVDSVRAGYVLELDRNRDMAAEPEASPGVPGDLATFTTTYTQEVSIDEHDVVKYDGRHLYIAPTLGMSCCFTPEADIGFTDVDVLLPPEPEPGSRSIRILSTDPKTASAGQVSTIDLADEMTVEGLYIWDERLAVITSTAWWGYYGAAFDSAQSWAQQSTGFWIYDVGAPEMPVRQWGVRIEGGFVTSRRAGDTVYLITRHTPWLDGLDFYPVDEASATRNEQLLAALTLKDIIPRMEVNGQESPLLAPSDCLVGDSEHALASQQRGYPVLTTIIAIDLRNPAVTDALCYLEETSGIYVSPNAIYLAQSDYGWPEDPQTIVHRFDYREGLNYRGSGKVKGELIAGSSPDFRISESRDYLRLVTTLRRDSESDRLEHFLHVLMPATDDLELESIATLPDASRPEPIGKPNEDLYGVRFVGDRAYLVTFERTDPLYVIDLSDHRHPRIAGELEVPGFSDFLHPVSDALLLGLGQDEQGRVKLELFDISTLSDPASLGALVLSADAQWSYSEARYDRHAFTYLTAAGGIDRFAIPVSAGFYEEVSGYTSEQRLHLLEIRGKDEPGTASIVESGYISTGPVSQYGSGSTRNRSVIHDDAVFFISADQVWSALWSNPFDVSGPQ